MSKMHMGALTFSLNKGPISFKQWHFLVWDLDWTIGDHDTRENQVFVEYKLMVYLGIEFRTS